MLLLLVLAAVGCAAQTPTPRDARAAGEWTFRLPETQSPYAGLAIAHGSGNEALAAVDDALADTPNARVAPQPAKPKIATKRTLVASAAPAARSSQAQPVAAETMATPVETQPLALNSPTTTSSEEQLYAQRESQSQKQREFRGGDAIVISASALVVILLVVILVLLLT
jgi:cobalamin biosynthesis Mg chelatase CobN